MIGEMSLCKVMADGFFFLEMYESMFIFTFQLSVRVGDLVRLLDWR